MRTAFRTSFHRDLKKLRKDRQLLERVRATIEEVESVDTLDGLSGLKKLSGESGVFYRLRVGTYRMGLELEDDVLVFVRCLHRRDIYRYFP